MNVFSAWVLSIAGICVVSVIIDLIMPEGQTNKYIKSVFTFFIVLVVISPLPKLVKSDFSLESLFSTQDIEIQNDFIYQLNRDKLDSFEDEIESDLKELKIEGVEIIVSANIFTSNMKIDAIFVDLFNLVINENNEHINIKESIINVIQKKIDIEEEKIIFNE